MLPYIFPEIYEHILNQLPIREGFELDDSTRTLAQCAASNSTLRAIACLSHIWKPHYQARWKHSRTTPEKHVARMVLFQGDYRRMYVDRRRRDKRALDALDRIVRNRNERHELSLVLIDELGTDILDVLKTQKASIPKDFKLTTAPSEDWFARNHWIDEISSAITRRDAVVRAVQLSNGTDMALEEGLSVFSGFWGVEFAEIAANLDDLAAECRRCLEDLHFELDPLGRKYDRVGLALEICKWMGQKGFLPAADSYHDLRNHYIHKVLTTHRKTLPLSLVSVFVALSRRLGVPASPVGFPGHVHAFVPLTTELAPRSPYASYYDAVQGGVHIDVYHSATEPFINVMQIVRNDQQEQLKLSSTHDMVFRAGKNILTSAQLHQTDLSSWELDLSVYGVFCVFLLEQQHSRTPARDFVSHMMAIVSQNYPLDVGPILQRTLAPALSGHSKELLETECNKLIEDEAELPQPAERRPVRYFSGLLFVHRIFDYIAVILEGDDHCHASNSWIVRFGIDALERGRNQPFYTVCAADGSSRYVAEDNIVPIAHLITEKDPEFSMHVGRSADDILRGLVQGFPGLGRHFLKPLEGPSGRLAFVPHPETLVRFPDDTSKADAYLNYGRW